MKENIIEIDEKKLLLIYFKTQFAFLEKKNDLQIKKWLTNFKIRNRMLFNNYLKLFRLEKKVISNNTEKINILEPKIIDTLEPKTIDTLESKTIDTLEPKITNDTQHINIIHLMVHMFEVGGGERYISEFNKFINLYGLPINEKLFLHKRYQSESNKNINNTNQNINKFNYDFQIIYYESWEECNQILRKSINNTIIIDHQLYWFEEECEKIVFNGIPEKNILRFIHGVPIHHQNISNRNFFLSYECYRDYNVDKSWNHIQEVIPIGTSLPIKNIESLQDKDNYNCNCNFKNTDNIIQKNKNIRIVIVGRINQEKIPPSFLKKLISFVVQSKKNIYSVKIYGPFDEAYENRFLQLIQKSMGLIEYCGVSEPDNVINIYNESDVLLHPSLSEAGATVVVEAMSQGLTVICRAVGGLPSIVGDEWSLCFKDNDFFEKLSQLNEEISLKQFRKNTEKVEASLTSEKHFKVITDSLTKHYDNYIVKSIQSIPNIVHFIFGLEKQVAPFPYLFYVSVLSCYKVNQPDKIYFHYHYTPYGEYWEKVKPYIILNYIPDLSIKWGETRIIKTAHKADKVRLEMLYKYGGIYMDIDTISFRPFKDYLKYDFCIGIQEIFGENQKQKTLYGNAILFSKPESKFIKKWMSSYEKYFNPDGWCEASVHYTNQLIEEAKEENNFDENIFIFQPETFYVPDYYHVKDIFENDKYINNDNYINNLITLHYWNSFSKEYINTIDGYETLQRKYPNSLFNYLMKKIFV